MNTICKEVIIVKKYLGTNTPGDPLRIGTEILEKDGNRILQHDPERYTPEGVIAFAKWCIENGRSPKDITLRDLDDWNKYVLKMICEESELNFNKNQTL